jgi:Outer membrane lipoprotein-sorting protein
MRHRLTSPSAPRPFAAPRALPCAFLLLLAVVAPRARAQNAAAIVDSVDQLMRGKSSRGSVTMAITTRAWSRTLDLRIWSLGTAYALVRVTAPPREAGTATLKVNADVWNYLPRVDRTIRIPPSLMHGAWLGSHFTNDDLVKESRLVQDYDIAASFDGERDGVKVWEFTLTPKPEAPVVWGKIVMRVRQADRLPVWSRYYDDAGHLARTLTFGEYRTFDGRRVPARLEVVPADTPDEKTVLTYHDLAFDVGLTPAFFSLRSLRDAR